MPETAQQVGRVGVVGDIHAEDRHLEATLTFLEQQGLDALLSVGDVVDGPGDADRCCALLEGAGVLTVRGNHDRWCLNGEMRTVPNATVTLSPPAEAFLRSLPLTRELDTPMGRMMLCHGVGEDDMAALTPETRGYSLQAIPTLRELMLRPDLHFTVGGHTHHRMVRRFQDLIAVNAGSLSLDHGAGFVVLDFEGHVARFFDIVDGARVVPAEELELA